MSEDKFLVVAKEIFDELPLTNKSYKPDSVNAIAEDLADRLSKKMLSMGWIDSVYKASKNNQPIFIDLNDRGEWNFLSMKTGTKEELYSELHKLGSTKKKWRIKI